MEQILLTPRELKRYNMVQARLKSGCKIVKILSDYNISRKAFYSNLHKFENEGIQGLKSRWGKHRKIEDKKEIEFERLFRIYPYFSSYEFSQIISLNPRTIQRIIVRKNLNKSYKPKAQRQIVLGKMLIKKKSTQKEAGTKN